MQHTKKKLATEDSKKKERHIVSWTQQVYRFPLCFSFFHPCRLLSLFMDPSGVISDMGYWSFRRMIFSESRLISMEQKSMKLAVIDSVVYLLRCLSNLVY